MDVLLVFRRFFFSEYWAYSMVLMLDANSEIDAHVRRNILLFDLFKTFN